MIQTIKWEASKRKPMTQGEMKANRKEGLVPAVISLRGEESVSVFLNALDIQKRPFGNFRIELKVKGVKEPYDCFLKSMQYDHFAGKPIHADLQGLIKGQEIDIDVHFELTGEPAGVKQGGILNTDITSVKIRTLPRNIPEKITIDISGLKIGESLHISDVKFSDDHTLLEPLEGAIVHISEPRMVETEASESGELPEPEIISEKSE